MDLLKTYQNTLAELSVDRQLFEECLKTGPDISAVEREVNTLGLQKKCMYCVLYQCGLHSRNQVLLHYTVCLQHIQVLLAEKADVDVFGKLICEVLKEESLLQPVTVWRILLWAETQNPQLKILMQEVKEKPDAQKLLQTSKSLTSK